MGCNGSSRTAYSPPIGRRLALFAPPSPPADPAHATEAVGPTGHPVKLDLSGWPATLRAWTPDEWAAEPQPRPAAYEHGNGLRTLLEVL